MAKRRAFGLALCRRRCPPAPAVAAPQAGVGDTSCDVVLDYVATSPAFAAQFTAFLEGYLAGEKTSSALAGDDRDIAALMAKVIDYCKGRRERGLRVSSRRGRRKDSRRGVADARSTRSASPRARTPLGAESRVDDGDGRDAFPARCHPFNPLRAKFSAASAGAGRASAGAGAASARVAPAAGSGRAPRKPW